jgi:hypothetical protein
MSVPVRISAMEMAAPNHMSVLENTDVFFSVSSINPFQYQSAGFAMEGADFHSLAGRVIARARHAIKNGKRCGLSVKSIKYHFLRRHYPHQV